VQSWAGTMRKRRRPSILTLVPALSLALVADACTTDRAPLVVQQASPSPSETGVLTNQVVWVKVAARADGEMPTDIALFTLAGTSVPGTAVHDVGDGSITYIFTPAAPLAAGAGYAVVFADGDDELDEHDYPASALRSVYQPVAGHQPIVEFSTATPPRVRLFYAAGPEDLRVSFSSEMDLESLTQVDLLDGQGNVIQAPRTWIADDYHQLSFAVSPTLDLTGVTLRLDDGVTSAAGIPMVGLPTTVSSLPIPVFTP
jgi:hypothetical protein